MEINTTFRPGLNRQENHDERDHDDSSTGLRPRALFRRLRRLVIGLATVALGAGAALGPFASAANADGATRGRTL